MVWEAPFSLMAARGSVADIMVRQYQTKARSHCTSLTLASLTLVSVTPIYHALANGKGCNERLSKYEVEDALPTLTTINPTTVHRGTSAAWKGVVCTFIYNTLAVNALSSHEKLPFFVCSKSKHPSNDRRKNNLR